MAALSSTRRRVQHLLRRASFGYSASELEEYVALGLEGAVERLLAPEAVDDSAADAAVAALGVDLEERRAGLWQAWHVRLEQSRRLLLEKLTYFWHGYFATAIHKVAAPSSCSSRTRPCDATRSAPSATSCWPSRATPR